MFFRNKLIFAIVIALLILGGVIFVLENTDGSGVAEFPLSLSSLLNGNQADKKDEAENQNPTGDTVVSSGDAMLPLTYQNKQFGFTLNIPEGYTGSSFEEGVGVTALLQNPETGESFQIYIAPFDEPGPITVLRIQQDLPELVITEPQVAVIAGGSIDAFIFIGESETFGKTREIWFVHGGQLYQVIAPFEMEKTIGPIMESLRFQ